MRFYWFRFLVEPIAWRSDKLIFSILRGRNVVQIRKEFVALLMMLIFALLMVVQQIQVVSRIIFFTSPNCRQE